MPSKINYSIVFNDEKFARLIETNCVSNSNGI